MKVHEKAKTDLNPLDFKKPNNSGKKNLIALNKEQRAELLKIFYSQNPKHGLIFELALNTGLRVNELANLAIENFNSYTHTVFIRNKVASKYTEAFTVKTPKSIRELSIPESLSKMLRAHIGSRKTGYIFISQRSPRYSKRSLINLINKYSNRCKSIPQFQNGNGLFTKNIGFHSLRRTYCSYLVSQSVPIDQIQSLMGHEYLETTFKYIKQIRPVNFKEIRKVLQKMNK
jgi:integrase/recombinase XerD